MIYEFICPHCKHEAEFIKPVKECAIIENCPKCNQSMYRKFSIPIISTQNSMFSKALGIETSKSNIDNMKKRYNERTGSELEFVGNSSSKVTPKNKDYVLPREVMAKIYD